ncbi:peptidylprolyl isomerase [Nocardia sp. SYP-A9097]|uniref:peptidylprolyl isomerase n=1 Tax=Nocardia sp. SYP-A9097 TaxID=2663237 RepID=UPI00132BDED6|nr:peptidylprolyl isomerase [Nocardia sp. SYP-A9097]MRH87316.1 peptidylprolyl isomerase [Nocardia sp. SYP-A9097]
MPSNEQRRAAAKRKLERQVASRAQRARKRKQLTIVASAVGVVVAVAAGVGIYYWTKGDDDSKTTASAACDYRPTQTPAARQVDKPTVDKPSDVKAANATLDTTQGPIGVQLDAKQSPCTVASFESLAKQKFFDSTTCHRMTTGEGLKVLQCGDPSATGSGGPGYQFDNEYPTTKYAPMDPAAQQPIDYKRGVLAMANAGPDPMDGGGTNGSQFFLVYGDSKLPPQYTMFGTVDEAGLATLDKIAAAGVQGGGGDGKPVDDVTIQSVRID